MFCNRSVPEHKTPGFSAIRLLIQAKWNKSVVCGTMMLPPGASAAQTNMVHLVLFRGTPSAVQLAIQTAKKAADGWCMLAPPPASIPMYQLNPQATAAMLVVAQPQAESLRNFFGRIPNLEVVVAQLQGDWAAFGVKDIADWLQQVPLAF